MPDGTNDKLCMYYVFICPMYSVCVCKYFIANLMIVMSKYFITNDSQYMECPIIVEWLLFAYMLYITVIFMVSFIM